MNGRYEVPRTAEVRSPYGTNVTFGKLDNCAKALGQYVDCTTVIDWQMVSSQGQGGQITAGALQGLGLGLGLAHSGSTVIQNATNNAAFFDKISPAGGHALIKK
jgi:hypothetical protein